MIAEISVYTQNSANDYSVDFTTRMGSKLPQAVTSKFHSGGAGFRI